MRRAATLIEMIFVIVIISLLATGSFKAMQAILVREYKAKQLTNLSLESQIVVNQISNYLTQRIVYSTIGYNPNDGSFEYIGDLTSSKPVLEWIGRANDLYLEKRYSGFFDMATKTGTKVASYGIDGTAIDTSKTALIFAGSFDRSQSDSANIASSFGWHESDREDTYDITISDQNISLDNPVPQFLYEKYFLVESAYAIARGENIDQNATCITDLGLKSKDVNSTLFLFSNYRPWKQETFCADKQGNSKVGNVSVLMQNIDGFNFSEVDYTIRILLDVNKQIRGAHPVHFSKMKVVF
ncbi:type II secretion system GspH family protein [Sulfurimonas sp. NW15]|uniref:type II secretion system protein n=1 Tax=Sulfurimonas sp. NW15 TaxID=2922729 RepID=UPI003DAA2BE2